MILVTGASGQLSSLIRSIATQAGLEIRAAGRTSSWRMDFDDPSTLDLRGVGTLLLISAGYGEDDVVIRRHGNIISAAERDGVGHIVYTSLTGTGDHLAFALAHRWTERRLRASAIGWTILRNGLYAELIADLAAPRDGLITAPFGTARLSPVARADLAEAAVTVLRDPAAHRGRIYELSGVTAWSLPDLARAWGVAYAPATLAEQRASLTVPPLLPFQPAMLLSIYSAAATGFLEADRTDLPDLLSASPRDSLTVSAGRACPEASTSGR